MFAFPLLVLTVSVFHWEAVEAAIEFWSSSHNYRHGSLLIPVVFGILIKALWKSDWRRSQWRSLPIALMLFSSVLLVINTIITVLVVQMSLVFAVLWLGIWAIFGWNRARRLILPFLVGMMAVPVWDFLIVPLQELTVAVTNYFLDVLRRTSYVEGNLVVLRFGSFHVEEGCSGMNFLVAGLMLSGLYAHWYFVGWQSKLLVITVGAFGALFANWIRVFLIVMAGDLSQMQHGLVESHIGFGWIVFGSVMGLLLLIESRVLHARSPDRSGPPAGVDNHAMRQSNAGKKYRWHGAFMLGGLMTTIAGPAVALSVFDIIAGAPSAIVVAWPDKAAGAPLIDIDSDKYPEPYFVGAHVRSKVSYEMRSGRASIAIFAYDFRDRQAELVGYPNRWYDPEQWHVVSQQLIESSQKGYVSGPMVLELRSENQRAVVVTAYLINGLATSNAIMAKVLSAKSYLSGMYVGSAMSVTLICKSNCSAEKDEAKLLTDALLAAVSISAKDT